jgi:3'-phosphoadenosine 5'-phosphosulfate sulfotransferase (PAPS reductase)/FAD synthetase
MTKSKHITHIVCLSGGKDSTAMALRLKEVEPRNYIYICTPTGDELPEMYSHWNNIEKKLGQPLIRLHDPETPTIYDLIDKFQMLPNFRARWCTRILKIELAQKFYEMIKPAVIYVGLRADEDSRKGNKLFDEHIEQDFPMQRWGWGFSDVLSYLDIKNINIPRRTDCAMCFYQRIGEWWNLWRYYPDIFWKISDIEDRIGHTLLSPGKWKNWPSKLSEMANEFSSGRIPIGADNYYKLFDDKIDGNCRICSM